MIFVTTISWIPPGLALSKNCPSSSTLLLFPVITVTSPDKKNSDQKDSAGWSVVKDEVAKKQRVMIMKGEILTGRPPTLRTVTNSTKPTLFPIDPDARYNFQNKKLEFGFKKVMASAFW